MRLVNREDYHTYKVSQYFARGDLWLTAACTYRPPGWFADCDPPESAAPVSICLRRHRGDPQVPIVRGLISITDAQR